VILGTAGGLVHDPVGILRSLSRSVLSPPCRQSSLPPSSYYLGARVPKITKGANRRAYPLLFS